MRSAGTTVREVRLDPLRHQATGRTRHLVDGTVWEGTRELQIVRYEGEHGVYLLYLDDAGREVTDTWHESLEHAMDQAEFEFSVKAEDWDAPEAR